MMRALIRTAGLAFALALGPLVGEIPEAHRRHFDEDGRLRWVPPPDPKVEELADGRLRIDDLILDPRSRSVLVPVALNARPDEELEYLLVHENGKVHESLLRTAVPPTYLHSALLLLGVEQTPKPGDDPETPDTAPPSQIDQTWLRQTRAPEGPPVRLELVLTPENGRTRAYPVEAFVTDLSRDAPIEASHWVYNGSRFNEGIFLAEVEGSFASLITDPAALVNYTGPGRTDDLNWVARAHPDAFPSQKAPLHLRLTLLDAAGRRE